MLKLYYSPGACSMAPHIILHETGLAHTVERVDLRGKRTENGRDFTEVNRKGAVPAIELENGEVLTENAVVLQFLGDRSGLGQVLPAMGDFRRYRVLEWVNYITTELHKSFSPLFGPDTPAEMKEHLKKVIARKFEHVEKELGDKPYLLGDHLTLPDAYLFVMLLWGDKLIGLDPWPSLNAFRDRMMQRESVRNVLEFEGLLEKQPAA